MTCLCCSTVPPFQALLCVCVMQGHLWRGPANVWDDAGFQDWDPCRKVQPPDYPPDYPGYPGRWAVVQSRLKIPAEDIGPSWRSVWRPRRLQQPRQTRRSRVLEELRAWWLVSSGLQTV